MLDHLCRERGAADRTRFRPSAHETSGEIGGVEGITRRRGIDRPRDQGRCDSPFAGFGAVRAIAHQRNQTCPGAVLNNNFGYAESV